MGNDLDLGKFSPAREEKLPDIQTISSNLQNYNETTLIVKFFNEKKYEKVLDLLNKSKSRDDSRSFCTMKGFCYMLKKEKNYEKGLHFLNRAYDLGETNNQMLHFLRAEAYLKLGKEKEGEKEMELSCKLDKTNDSLVRRGLYYQKKKDWENAILDYTEALKIKPIPNILFERGYCYYNIKKNEEAESDLDKCIEMYLQAQKLDRDKISDAFTRRALCCERKKNIKKAIEYMNKSIEYNETSINLNMCGNYFLQLKQYKESLRYFEKAIKIDPGNFLSYYSKGISKYHLELNKESIVDFEEALNLTQEPNQKKNILEYLEQLYERSNYFEKMAEVLSELINQYPDIPKYYKRRAHVYKELKEYEKSIEDYEKALVVESPSEFMIMSCTLGKASIYVEKDNFKKAISICEEGINLIKNKENISNIKENIGKILVKFKMFKEAIVYFTEAIELGGENVENIHLQRANCWKELGENEKEKNDLKKYQRLRNLLK